MRKRTSVTSAMKYCESVFACVVIAACAFTLYSTISSSGSYKYRRNTRTTNVLRQASDSFRQLMKRLKKESPTLDPSTIEQPDSQLYFDNYREWFTARNVSRLVSHKKHATLRNIVLDNADICKNLKSVDILIYFQSRWDNFVKRSALRETWANKNVFHDITVRVIFILGKPEKATDQIKIKNENLLHHDIIQGDFIDSFHNLTLKSVLALHWINKNCLNSRYIVKADDDMFVNIFALVEYLVTQIYEKNRVVMCQLKENATSVIIRDPHSKWYVPKEIFPAMTHFPTFCSGYMVLFTSDLIPDLYKHSFSAPYFSVDDVYLFGYLMSKMKQIVYEDISNTLTLNQKSGLEEYRGDGPLVHVGINAWEKGTLEKLWTSTLLKMSEWTKKHAKIMFIRNNSTKVKLNL